MAELSVELRELRDRLYDGGGAKRIAHQHAQGKLTARERVDRLLDEGEPWVEIGLLVAYDLYDGAAPSANPSAVLGILTQGLGIHSAISLPSAIIPAASRLTTSTEMGPSMMSAICWTAAL